MAAIPPQVTEAFCGPATPKPGGSERAATIPTKEQRAADPPVAFSAAELAATATEEAARRKAAQKRLLRGAKLAEAAAVFVEERNEDDDESVKKQQFEAATTWLIDAMKAASLDPAIAAGVRQLLAVKDFTGNLSAKGQWDRLQEELGNAMAALGEKRLAPLFDRFDLGTAMSAATVATLFSIHPLAANLAGAKPSQELALPALVAVLRKGIDFDNPAAMGQRVGLHVVQILFVLLNDRFQEMIATVAKKAGCTYSGAAPKGYARSLVKLYKDYLKQPTPRAAFILDGLRALLLGDGVLSVHAAISELSEVFGGVVQVKDPFALPLEQRQDRAHLLILNVTGVHDAKTTFKRLLAKPAAKALLAKLRDTPDGEPKERWQRHFDEAMTVLADPSLAEEPVKVCVEVQVTFTSFGGARKVGHYMYDGSRADDCTVLHDAFKGAVEETVAEDLYSACFLGQLDAARRFVTEVGADVNELDDGTSVMFVAAENNQCDVLAFLVESKADVDVGDTCNGRTPLYTAAQQGFDLVVQQLVDANADVNMATTDNGKTPLYAAASRGFDGVVQQLADANADVNLARTDIGMTPLWTAAEAGFDVVVQQLVDANADVNLATTDDGQTPLLAAANKGFDVVVKQLVDANADINLATTDDSTSPLYMAAQNGHAGVVQILVVAGADGALERTDTCCWCISDNETPLKAAEREGHAEVVSMLQAM